jgi:hypothetical protein
MRFNIRQKVVLLIIAFLAPAAVCFVLLIEARGEPIEQNRRERWGLEYLRPLRQLQEQLPQLAAALRGRAGESARTVQLRDGLQQAIARLDDVDLRLGRELATTEDLMRLEKNLRPLLRSGDRAASPQLLEEIERQSRILTILAGDSSGLILDSSLNSFYLAKSLIRDLPHCQERLHRLRALVQPRREGRALPAESEAQIPVQVALLRRDLADLEEGYRVAVANTPGVKSTLELAASQMLAKARAAADLLEQRPDPAPQDDRLSGVLDDSFRLYDRTLAALDELLRERVEQGESERREVAFLMLLGLLPGLGLAAWTACGSSSSEPPARPSPESAGAEPGDERHHRLAAENRRLKALVADLVLEQRTGP